MLSMVGGITSSKGIVCGFHVIPFKLLSLQKSLSPLYEGGKWGSTVFAWAGTKLVCFGWCLHGFGQWRGMVVGGYGGADIAVRGAVGGSEMGRHYGKVG